MKKIIVLFISLLVFCIIMQAQNIDISTAQIVARNFYYEKANQFEEKAFSEINISESFIQTDIAGQTVYYIFNIYGGGFIAVSAYNAAEPVPFYSFKGKYDTTKKNHAFDFWTKQYVNEISYLIANNIKSSAPTLEKWLHLSTAKENELEISKDKAVPPLIISEWDQGTYYNEQCPVDIAGPDGHTLTGCVATCMGQILYYHKFPETGTGNYTYSHPTYGPISADFGNTTYEWNGMQNKLTDSNYPVAILLHHLGVGVDMDYGPTGSGMWNHSAAYVYRTYFKMCPETRYIFRDSVTLDWDSVIIANLDAKKPLYYAGWADDTSYTSGHAFVCDGYQSPTYYHFNWGWGGSYDGFFYTNALSPGGSNFNHVQELIVDIYPDTLNYTYPQSCSVPDTNIYAGGTINDGSSMLDYENDLDCDFLISPICGNMLELVFDRFELSGGDTIIISDDIQAIDTFTIADPPILSYEVNPTYVNSNTGNIYINFKTDVVSTADGWDISYYSKYCESTAFIYDSTGTVADGSESCDYLNSENCRWTIAPPGADTIYMDFTQFDFAPNLYDYILIHKTSVSAANLIGKFDYTNVPSQLTIPSGTVIITFKTDNFESGQGWEFNYLAGFNSVDINNDFSDELNAMVYPNPFSKNTKITYYINKNTKTRFAIHNIYGELIASYSEKSSLGLNEIELNKISNNIVPGIYFITIFTENSRLTKKIICTK